MADKIIQTPKGVATWPFLTKPYTQFKPDGEYKVTLVMSEDDDGVKEFIGRCDTSVKKMKAKNAPYTYDADERTYSLKFSSQYRPALFDSHGVKITDEIQVGSGSVIVCAVEPKPYDGFGGGIKFYLKAVQILEFVEYSGSTADDYGFAAQEEGFSVGSFKDFGGDTVAENMNASVDDDTGEDKKFDW